MRLRLRWELHRNTVAPFARPDFLFPFAPFEVLVWGEINRPDVETPPNVRKTGTMLSRLIQRNFRDLIEDLEHLETRHVGHGRVPWRRFFFALVGREEEGRRRFFPTPLATTIKKLSVILEIKNDRILCVGESGCGHRSLTRFFFCNSVLHANC